MKNKRADIIIRHKIKSHHSIPLVSKFIPFIPLTNKKIDIIIEFENKETIPFSGINLKVSIEGEKIEIGANGIHPGAYATIQFNLEDKGADAITIIPYTPLVSGKYLLSVTFPDRQVDNKGKEDKVRFFNEDGQPCDGDWMTYFEVYSWYIIGILIGTIPVGILAIIEILSKLF